MKKQIKEIEIFIEDWCLTLGVPVLELIIAAEAEMGNETVEEEDIGVVYILEEAFNDMIYTKYVIFHEIMHWYLYHKLIGKVYRDENIVEMVTNELFSENYPKYWRDLCSKKLI